MQRLAKLSFFLFITLSVLFLINPKTIFAGCTQVPSNQTSCSGTQAFACSQVKPPAGNISRWCCDDQTSCDQAKGNVQQQIANQSAGGACIDTVDPEFHSLRPYPMQACGGSVKARYCSNDLVFIEDFDMAGKGDCTPRGETGEFSCDPSFHVNAHTLYVQLDDSHLPIMGNTEDQLDDATKVNEYASWYLNGVVDKAENKDATDEQIVNFSGPVRKLLPYMIQDAQRIKIIKSASNPVTVFDDDLGEDVTSAENHDQLVIDKERLSSWGKGDLSFLRSVTNLFNPQDAWDKRYPPLPWDDGTIDDPDLPKVPFTSRVLYYKAYNEWKGKSCTILPFVERLVCIDIKIPTIIGTFDLITNKYADLWHFVPLSNTSDKKGSEYIAGGGDPQYIPSAGTEIGPVTSDKVKIPPLYFSHMQEVKDLSEILNMSYTPKDVESVPLPDSTEFNNCSVAVVRTNKGDNLFPGDTNELQVPNVEYDITQATCHETYRIETRPVIQPDGSIEWEDIPIQTFECPAQITVKIKTGTKTPWANELFATTVADSGSTFRKIFPKVEEGAPVSCVADIPTITDVTYDPDIGGKSQIPDGGGLEFKVVRFPEDGSGESPQLTFPHIGSIYEYFLKGIQTALRPKGYGGEQPVSGQNCTNVACGELPKNLPKASGSCSLGGISSRVGEIPQSLKDIISAAAETYKVPPNLILGIMYGEGLFDGSNKKDWTDENVKSWSTCQKVPNCYETGDDNFMGFNGNDWDTVKKGIEGDLKKLDPNREEPSPCNLIDAVYGEAWNLHDSADGGGPSGNISCFGIALKSSVPNSCTWNDNQYESAIKIAENGYDLGCFTLPGSCAGGGGNAALCNNGVDGCETLQNPGARSSHNACVWDVSHGN